MVVVVDVGEDFGCLVQFGEGGECLGGFKDGRVVDVDDGYKDDVVYDVGQNSCVCVFDGDDKGIG